MVTYNNPMAAFISWFDSLPVQHKKFLAHLYCVCTTDNTIDMVRKPEISLTSFKYGFVKQDFTLRVAARLFAVRAVFDLILMNHEALVSMTKELSPEAEPENVEMLSSRQWDRVFSSWKELRSKELSDAYLHVWASEIIQKRSSSF